MALDKLTKVQSVGISSFIQVVGVVTATQGFDGNITGIITATSDLTFGANSKAKLFENGTQSGVQATSSTSSAHLMTHDGNEDIHVDPSGYIKVEVAGSERLRMDSSGRLLMGVNSTSFTTRALFQGSSSGTGGSIFIARNQATPSDGAALGSIFFGASNHSQASRIASARDGGTWTAGSSQPSRIEFATTANGASTPTERLRIKSDSQLLHTRSDDTTRYDLEFRQTGGISDGNYGGLHWTQGSTGSTDLAAVEIAYATNGRPDIVFKTRQSGGTTISEAARITSTGSVGIATADPSYRLDIGDGVTDPANGYQLRVNAAGDYIFALQRQSNASFSIRNNSTGTVHLNTQNSKTLSFGVNSGNVSGSIEDDVRIDSNGHLTILDGNLVVANGHGIDFSATSDAAGMNNELLDDYEEGTWTPSLQGAVAGTGSFTPHGAGVNKGIYRKVGGLVYIQGNLRGTWSPGTASGLIHITGLPITNRGSVSGEGNANYGPVNITYAAGLTPGPSGYYQCGGLVIQGSNIIHVYKNNGNGGGIGNIIVSEVSSASDGVNWHFSACYASA